MFARRKIIKIKTRNDIETAIAISSSGSKVKTVALKDCHLLDAAIQKGRFITSCDENAFNAFSLIKEIKVSVNGITWANPVDEHENLMQKIENKSSLVKIRAL